jgi:hypothetical protein
MNSELRELPVSLGVNENSTNICRSGVTAPNGKGKLDEDQVRSSYRADDLRLAINAVDHTLQMAAFEARPSCDMPGPTPAFTVLISINAPLALPVPFGIDICRIAGVLRSWSSQWASSGIG